MVTTIYWGLDCRIVRDADTVEYVEITLNRLFNKLLSVFLGWYAVSYLWIDDFWSKDFSKLFCWKGISYLNLITLYNKKVGEDVAKLCEAQFEYVTV